MLSKSDSVLEILLPLSQSLPISLQVLKLTCSFLNSQALFKEEIRNLWKMLDTTLSSKKYSHLQSVKIQWDILQNPWKEDSQFNKTTESKSEGCILKNIVEKEILVKESERKVRIKDELNILTESKIFENTFPLLYKSEILWCGSSNFMESEYIYQICSSNRVSNVWSYKQQSSFLDL